jgi:carboxyl-terminal processing protease
MLVKICARCTLLLMFLFAPAAVGASESLWRVTFDTNWLGPMDAHLRLDIKDGRVTGKSISGVVDILRELPGDHDISGSLVVFEAIRQDDGSYRGTFTAPWHEGELSLRISEESLEGTVAGGAFDGRVSGARVTSADPIRDYKSVLAAFDDVMTTRIFSPDRLRSPAYRSFRAKAGEVAALATDDLDLLLGFHMAWQDPPFSHFSFKRSHQSAEKMFAFFDEYRVGFEAATVEFDDDIAVLTVRTMMGVDTIEQIEAAFTRIAAEEPSVLVIDLRGNTGGAFAVKPLLEHVIDEPVNAGYFLSQVWNRQNDRLPTRDEVMRSEPWHGWSIVSFWKTVQEAGILRVRFAPTQPNFDGPVYVLVDSSAASATELAADAFRASGVATLVGERTAGEMLSQSIFDVADGFQVSLPVADYYSMTHGRIEGNGVPVDVRVAPTNAMEYIKQLVSARQSGATLPEN